MIKFQKVLRFIPLLNLLTLLFLSMAMMRSSCGIAKFFRIYVELFLPFAVILVVRAIIMNNFVGLFFDIATTLLLYFGMFLVSCRAVSMQERYF